MSLKINKTAQICMLFKLIGINVNMFEANIAYKTIKKFNKTKSFTEQDLNKIVKKYKKKYPIEQNIY